MPTLQLPTPTRVPSRPAVERSARSRWLELAGASVLFAALSFAVFGWYAFHGGFIADDWVNADHYYFHPDSGFWGAVDNYQTPSRPAAAVYVTLTYAVLGTNFDLHLVLSVLLAAFLSTAFYAFLRTLGVGLPFALAAAALLLVFPSSDSTRLWSTGSQINLFIGLYLVGATIAVIGRRRFGPAPTVPAVLTQLLATALVVTAVAGYEIMAPAILLSAVLYRWVGKGGVVWRWLLDAIPTLLILYFFTRKFGAGGPAGGVQLLTNVRFVADGAFSVLGFSLHPTRLMSRSAVVVGVAGVIFVILLVRRIALNTPDRDAIVRWLRPLLLSIAAIVVGYLMIVPVVDRYPLYAPGVQNRTNCFAALGFSALVVCVLAAVAAMVVAALPRLSERTRARSRTALTTLLVLGMLGVYSMRIVQDEHRWEKASQIQTEILGKTRAFLPSPPPDATIFTSPYPGNVSPGVPIFGGGGNNDQVGAFKVAYGSDEMRAFPLLKGLGLICGRRGMATPDAGNSGTAYGKAILLDFRRRKRYRPKDQSECIEDAKAMRPYGLVNKSLEW